MSARPAPSLALLSAITALAFCGLHMVVPALPLLVAVFTDTPAHVQLVVSLYLAGIATGQLVYGPVSDRFGRRPVLLAGLAAFLVGTALCGAAGSLPALIAGRVVQALGACAGVGSIRIRGVPPAEQVDRLAELDVYRSHHPGRSRRSGRRRKKTAWCSSRCGCSGSAR